MLFWRQRWNMSSEGKRKNGEGSFSPKAVVATGHDQGAVSVEMNLRVETSHHFTWSMLILNLEDSSKVDNKNELTAETGSEWAGNVFRHFPVFTSHILTLSSNWRQREKKKHFCTFSFQKPHKDRLLMLDVSALVSLKHLLSILECAKIFVLTDPDTIRLDWGLKLQQKT